MVDERIAEALHNIITKTAQFILGEVERGQQLIEHHTTDERPDYLVLACIADNVQASKESYR